MARHQGARPDFLQRGGALRDPHAARDTASASAMATFAASYPFVFKSEAGDQVGAHEQLEPMVQRFLQLGPGRGVQNLRRLLA